ncbi:alpha/beta hydrolase fold domain-containing protein [Caballeronia sp. 15715]|uniref:alpha/beta hydrolase fold domain-containing protein n=1 Tax=Caballeronia sp. 15715 TaxID=3391030 RepID=UPI0039E4DD42
MKPTLEISDVAIDGYAQKITLRSFRPLTRNSLPIVLYFHGGCFVKGTLDDADIPASFIASKTPAWVVAVGYSLAPAFPFPAAIEDAYLALEWATLRARESRADVLSLAAVGFDAGGNIAAGLAAIARDRARHKLSAQALLAPLLDPSMTRLIERTSGSKDEFGMEDCSRSYRAYLPSASQRVHPYAAPLESRRLGTLPPTLIASAEEDQLLTFIATEIAQKHIPLMRKLMTAEGIEFTTNKLLTAYGVLDARLADGRAYLTGKQFTVADAYVWATLWHERSGVKLDHLKNLMAYTARIEARPAVQKALTDEAEVVSRHQQLLVA